MHGTNGVKRDCFPFEFFPQIYFVSTIVAIQLVIVFNVLLRFCARVVRNTSSNSTRNEFLGSSAISYV